MMGRYTIRAYGWRVRARISTERHVGALENPDLHSEGFNPFCGDQVVFTLNLDEIGRIKQVGFQGEGCSISQASASMLTDHLIGRTLDDTEQFVRNFKDIMQGAELTEAQEEDFGEIVALQGVKEFPIRRPQLLSLILI